MLQNPRPAMPANNNRSKKRTPLNAAVSKHAQVDYAFVLTAIFSLMLKDGMQAKALLGLCTRSVRQAEARARLGQTRGSSVLLLTALVLDAWHRDRRYISATATPKAIRLLGPAPSVEGLVRMQRGRRNSAQGAKLLRTLGLVVRHGSGLYRPLSDAAVISANNPFVLQHLAKSLSTLLETVGQNMNGKRGLAPLIERVAEVPDLPRKHVAAFQRFTQVQGRIFLRTVNDWLESRRARRTKRLKSHQTVRAGIHAYAYVASHSGQYSPLRS
jgi:hypothetical protein